MTKLYSQKRSRRTVRVPSECVILQITMEKLFSFNLLMGLDYYMRNLLVWWIIEFQNYRLLPFEKKMFTIIINYQLKIRFDRTFSILTFRTKLLLKIGHKNELHIKYSDWASFTAIYWYNRTSVHILTFWRKSEVFWHGIW